jgi:hypothetical protein
MKPTAIRAQIIANTAEMERLRDRLFETAIERDKQGYGRDPAHAAWVEASAEFLRRADTLMFPGGYRAALEKFRAGDTSVTEPALCFLEVRPYFHRSGYMYGVLMRRVRRAGLSASQRQRLDEVLARDAAWKARKGRKSEA